MTNIIEQVKIDRGDPRYVTLRDTFTEEIKKRFSSEDYEPIVDFVFKYVFESKNTKDDAKKEMRDLFSDKTEEIIDLLWNQTGKIYGAHSGDLLEEIYKDEGDSKKFPSQIVHPGDRDSKSSKPLFNDAIGRVREDKHYRHKNKYDRGDNYSRRYDNDRDRNNRDDRRRDSRRDDTFRTVNIGGKKMIIRNKRGSKSRSRSPRDNRERSRDEEPHHQHYNEKDQQMQGGDVREHGHHYGRDYYPQYQRGYYPMRRFSNRGGRYGRFMQPRYMDPRGMDPRSQMPMRRLGPPRFPKSNDSRPEAGDDNNVTIPSEETSKEHNTGNNINNNIPVEGGEAVPHEERIVDPAKKKQIRCKKWPLCKNDNCEFAHPTETCPHFPKCSFGNRCRFIHPNIPCKYGFYCTRVNCAYSHSSGYNPGMYPPMSMIPGMPMPFGARGPRNTKYDHTKKDFNRNKNNEVSIQGEGQGQSQGQDQGQEGNVNNNPNPNTDVIIDQNQA